MRILSFGLDMLLVPQNESPSTFFENTVSHSLSCISEDPPPINTCAVLYINLRPDQDHVQLEISSPCPELWLGEPYSFSSSYLKSCKSQHEFPSREAASATHRLSQIELQDLKCVVSRRGQIPNNKANSDSQTKLLLKHHFTWQLDSCNKFNHLIHSLIQ